MNNSSDREDVYHVKFIHRNGNAIDALTKLSERSIIDEVKKAKAEHDLAHIDCCDTDGSYISVRFIAEELLGMIYRKYTPQAETQREATRQPPRIIR